MILKNIRKGFLKVCAIVQKTNMNKLIAVLCQLKHYFRPFVQKYDPLWPDLPEEHPLYSLLQERMTSLAEETTEMDNMKWCFHINIPLSWMAILNICALFVNSWPLIGLLFVSCCSLYFVLTEGSEDRLRSWKNCISLRPYGQCPQSSLAKVPFTDCFFQTLQSSVQQLPSILPNKVMQNLLTIVIFTNIYCISTEKILLYIVVVFNSDF